MAITFHEAAHGFVAHALGDNTAAQLGRVSINPIKHIDPVGTVLLPGMLLLSHAPFLFGYAKPVPVNFRNLHNPRLGMVWVVLAVFNMMPIPPLDGGRVAVGLLPNFLAYPLSRLEPWGMLILIGFLIVL